MFDPRTASHLLATGVTRARELCDPRPRHRTEHVRGNFRETEYVVLVNVGTSCEVHTPKIVIGDTRRVRMITALLRCWLLRPRGTHLVVGRDGG